MMAPKPLRKFTALGVDPLDFSLKLWYNIYRKLRKGVLKMWFALKEEGHVRLEQ